VKNKKKGFKLLRDNSLSLYHS